MIRTLRRAAAIGVAATLLTATAAAAHPQFNPSELPAGQPIETHVVVPHGCGEAQDGATTSIEVAWDDRVRAVPAETEGWEPFLEAGVAWGWRDAGGATTDVITLPVALSVEGELGTHIDLIVRQACDATGDSNLWGAGDPAFPAARLTIAEAVAEGAHADDADHADDSADDADDMADDADHADDGMDMADDAEHADDTTEGVAPVDEAADHGDAPASAGADGLTIGVMALVTLGGIGGILRTGRKK